MSGLETVCSCVPGQGEACSHVAVLRIYLQDKMRHKDRHLLADTSSTGRLQQWHVRTKRVLPHKFLKQSSFRKVEYGKQLLSPSSESAAVTLMPVSLATSPISDIVGLFFSDLQKSVGYFWNNSFLGEA